ncbi:hypothetical protein J19TS2_17290 [Cohnella xylanilytica]|uniref:WG repeat-containing protein n=1 Tax=Cohnella xylanilytica TaxID=557555 RepID=UPI001B1DB65A|nr:WG repeat-containing protein [Cohnella xylanilytica]GIO12174.1 hypothetical protein J19TS2_17290 [Cohnella xylanilytica]
MFKKIALFGVMILGVVSSAIMPQAHAETAGTYAISPIYTLAEPFSEGFAAVYGTDGWGYIDTNGKEVIKPSYAGAKSFSEGLAPVNVANWGEGNKWGFIDKTGKMVIQPKYSIAEPFVGGYAVVYSSDFKAGVINKQGKVVINLKYDHISLYDGIAIAHIQPTQGQEYDQALDMTGKALFKYPHIGFFFEGLGLYSNDHGSDIHYGFIDKTGKIVIQAKYEQILAFSEGLAPVKQNDKWGFINKQGKFIIKPQYHDALPFSEGLAAVYGNGGWGFIDKNGKEVVKPQYYSVKAFGDGIAAVELNNRNWIFIDKTGKVVIDSQFLDVTDTHYLNDTSAFREGLCLVLANNKKFGYILNPLNNRNVPSDWAKSELEAAKALNLVPDELANSYKYNISRKDFSKLIVQFLTVKTGKSIDELLSENGKVLNTATFADSDDTDILAANALGIVSGKGNAKFAPYDNITRQEAAVILTRAARFLNITPNITNLAFGDEAKIAGWAQESVAYIASLKDATNNSTVMGGTEKNLFGPTSYYTKEQAIITVKRLYNVQ